MLEISERWKQYHPEAHVGCLWMDGVVNPREHAGLEGLKNQFEMDMREQYGGLKRSELESLPQMQPNVRYYKQYDKTYPVLLQFDSLVNKGKGLPHVAALVEAMFLAELNNHLLTAGHDVDVLCQPLRLDASQGGEEYMMMNGKSQQLKPGDMTMWDGEGIISNVLYGPDRRTAIHEKTRRALFVTYAPPGIACSAIEAHLHQIEGYARLLAPQAQTVALDVVGG